MTIELKVPSYCFLRIGWSQYTGRWPVHGLRRTHVPSVLKRDSCLRSECSDSLHGSFEVRFNLPVHQSKTASSTEAQQFLHDFYDQRRNHACCQNCHDWGLSTAPKSKLRSSFNQTVAWCATFLPWGGGAFTSKKLPFFRAPHDSTIPPIFLATKKNDSVFSRHLRFYVYGATIPRFHPIYGLRTAFRIGIKVGIQISLDGSLYFNLI